MNNINKFQIQPLQAELNEWILTPEGSLVKSNAKKKHSQMDEDVKTDYLPGESYVFSNDPDMVINKKAAKDIIYGREYLNYTEGKSGKIPKDISLDKFFPKDKSTPAEIIKNLATTYKVLDADVHMDNPFIRRANEFNKETRQKPVEIVRQLNEFLRPKSDEELQQEMQQEATGIPAEQGQQQGMEQEVITQQGAAPTGQYKYGGYHRALNYQSGGEVLSGIGSGAAAGVPFAAATGGLSILGGALIGGIGSAFVGSAKRKEAKKLEEERKRVFADWDKRIESGYGASNLATLGKAAVPLPSYEFLNLDSVKDRTSSTYNRLLGSENSRRNSQESILNGMTNTGLRALSSAGASPDQVNNYLSNVTANSIDGLNKNSQYYDNYYDTLKMNQTNSLNGIDLQLAGDKQLGTNTMNNNKYNRDQNVIGEFGNNYQDYNNKKSSQLMQDYMAKEALRKGNAAEAAQAQGTWSNGLNTIGSAYSKAQGSVLNNKLLQSQIDYNTALTNNVQPRTSDGTQPLPVPPSSTIPPAAGNPAYDPNSPGNNVRRGNQEYYKAPDGAEYPVQVDPKTGKKFYFDSYNNYYEVK